MFNTDQRPLIGGEQGAKPFAANFQATIGFF